MANGIHILANFDLILDFVGEIERTANFLPNDVRRQLFAWRKSLVK
jgi:hypothetical protein